MEMIGSISKITMNDSGLYLGNLKHYLRVVFREARNLTLPYHNFRHMMHVLFLCHEACIFYKDKMTPKEMRNLLIAAIFHDYNHTGLLGRDYLNIALAIRGLKKHILFQDREELPNIIASIDGTEFPYKIDHEKLNLSGKILRDADMSQCFSVAWIQQVVFGLATEWKKTPIEVLKNQSLFLKNLHFQTEWAQQLFTVETIDAKIKETIELFELLDEKDHGSNF